METTLREALYMETRVLDIEHVAKKKQLFMKHRIQDNAASDLMKVTINAKTKGGWKQRTEKLENKLNIDTEDYTKSKQAFKTDIGKKINKNFKDTIEEKGKNKSKVQHLKHGQPDWKPGNT